MQRLHPHAASLWVTPHAAGSAFSDADLAREMVEDVLLSAEDQMALGMWKEAAATLDSLPDDLEGLLHVALVRLDVFIGQELWNRGLMLALGLLESNSTEAELWLRIARLMAGAGKDKSALRAATKCMELDAGYSPFIRRDRLLGPLGAQVMAGVAPIISDTTRHGQS
jgi:hypothetical protein